MTLPAAFLRPALLGSAIVLLVLATAIVGVSIRETRAVAAVMEELKQQRRPIVEAAYEIEINLFEISAAALGYLAHGDSADLRLVESNRRELYDAIASYDRLTRETSDSSGVATLLRLTRLTREFDAATDALLAASADEPPPMLRRPADRARIERFHELQRALDHLLDDSVQASAVDRLHARADDARTGSRSASRIILLLAPTMLLVVGYAAWAVLVSYRRTSAALARAEQLSRQKTELASITAHELRSPLTAMLGSLRLMASGRAGTLPPTAVPYVEMASRSSARLLTLINDLLDLDRIEAGMMSFAVQPVPCDRLVRAASEGLTGMAQEAGVTLLPQCRTRREVRGDPDRLHQVLVNLISNAVKHAPDDTAVEVIAEDRGAMVRFKVRDFGPGIAPADRERIFQRFTQASAPAATSGHPSTGLGLAIAREIVHRHGGTMGVESELGQGATFWFDIPAV